MTGLNHAVTGALVAVAAGEPAIALPVALLSHFVIDSLPHWDYEIPGHPKIRRMVIGLDMLMSILLVALLALMSADSAWLVLACGFLAILPDTMWLPYILYGKPSPTSGKSPLNRLRHLHFKIQWSESAAGIYAELLWFVTMLGLFLYITD